MFPINPAIISAVLKSKLDEIITGKNPDGFKVIEKTSEKIHLAPQNIEQFEGITVNELIVSFTYKNILIKITHE
jgi:hypothetical protein